MKLSIIVNLSVVHKPVPFTTAQRTVVEDGITTIRPWRNGVPGGTEREVDEAFARLEDAFSKHWEHDGRIYTGALVKP